MSVTSQGTDNFCFKPSLTRECSEIFSVKESVHSSYQVSVVQITLIRPEPSPLDWKTGCNLRNRPLSLSPIWVICPFGLVVCIVNSAIFPNRSMYQTGKGVRRSLPRQGVEMESARDSILEVLYDGNHHNAVLPLFFLGKP